MNSSILKVFLLDKYISEELKNTKNIKQYLKKHKQNVIEKMNKLYSKKEFLIFDKKNNNRNFLNLINKMENLGYDFDQKIFDEKTLKKKNGHLYILRTLIIILYNFSKDKKIKKGQIIKILKDEYDGLDYSKNLEILVKKYLNILVKHGSCFNLKTKRGVNGGYWIERENKNEIHKLNKKQRNALNDAIEFALKGQNFHYIKDLREAQQALYNSYEDLKDQDYEYYLGIKHKNINKIANLTYQLKKYCIDKSHLVKLTFKNSIQVLMVIPLFIVHDSDETFLFYLEEGKTKEDYCNILEIKSSSLILDKKLDETHPDLVNANKIKINSLIKESSVLNKPNVKISISLSEEGIHKTNKMLIMDKEMSIKNKNEVTILFEEKDKAISYLINIFDHIESFLEIKKEENVLNGNKIFIKKIQKNSKILNI